MCKPNFRHEYKHYINYADYLSLRQRLRQVAARDRHAGPNGSYTVHSLYFDNLDNKALREKLDGVNHREKFRIRYYNSDTSFLRLEKKSKHNSLGCKQSAVITPEECGRILSRDIEWMQSDRRELVMELYRKIRCQLLRPKTPVVYDREAYLYPAGNVRITVDSRIRMGLSCADFLFPDAPCILAKSPMILEVKYDAFLPDLIGSIVQERNRQSSAFSKYAACRAAGGYL
ncbi:polyphosphate polymerase domain-containing protein [Anaerotruncus rubiinfantis]|uniref:polyphosphate polymerase domain-containing protein n=1 Tax=Anaerotruncus rubiinfantis TaxID=1720200 RepID=UPI000836FDD5|nr:polyphosphate polymerase domain-containing protein [Anaerotruncus rubiinfantis]